MKKDDLKVMVILFVILALVIGLTYTGDYFGTNQDFAKVYWEYKAHGK